MLFASLVTGATVLIDRGFALGLTWPVLAAPGTLMLLAFLASGLLRHEGLEDATLELDQNLGLSDRVTTGIAFASLEHEGLMNAGDDFFDFILLDQLGSMNETRLSQAVIPTANGSAETTSVATFDASADEAALFFDISASAAYEAGANDTFAFLRSRTANITRFTTDEQVRVTLTGNASLESDLNFQTTPRLPQTVLSIITEPGDGDPLFEVENIEGAFAFEIVLEPGSYQLRSAVDDTIQTFGFPAGVYSASSELVLTATITTITA